MARPMQIAQRISSKMAALRRSAPPVDPNPLVRYHPPQPPMVRPVPTRPAPWRRSRVQRITHLRKRRRERMRRSGPGSKRVRTAVLSTIAALLLILLTSTASYAYNFYQSALPQVQSLANFQRPQSTRIYDRNGNLLYTLYANSQWGEGGRSTPVSYNYLPGVLQDAQIAAEDPTFWTNNGVDPQGMLRALQQYISAGGRIQSGGSTMTQQLIKNLSGNNQETFQRKMSEAALAIGLTEEYPKWKIMEMYFNDTPYGAQEEGVEAAVEDYFGLQPQCNMQHQCVPAVAFLDRDLSKCKNPKDQSTCANDPTGMLALARAVLLAGIPQNPTHFDPSVSQANFQNVLTNRVPYVIGQMIADGMDLNLGLGTQKQDMGPITQAMVPQVEEIISKMTIVGFHQLQIAPHFVQWVIQTLSDALGNGDYDTGYGILVKSGLNIYTTLDLNLEQFVEKDVKYNLTQPRYELYTGYGPLDTVYNVNDSAVVVMNAQTGEVLAMDGSEDYNNKNPAVSGEVNAALALRQPGSSFKPIEYAAAFEKGWYPGIKLMDDKTYFPQGGSTSISAAYVPTDYQHSYHPTLPTDIRISLANSFNIPAIKAFMFAGADDVVSMARRLGITDIDTDLAYDRQRFHNPNLTMSQDFGPSMAIGTAGVSLLQMTNAYQAFADNGMRVPYHNILDIWDNYGHNLYHYDPMHPNATRVLSPQITFLVNNILTDNYSRRFEFQGIDTLTMDNWQPSYQVAAKTGTTDNFLDNWTIGFTTKVVVGVWSGNADGNDPMRGVIGISGAGPIWQDVIEYASGDCELGMCPDLKFTPTPFPQPDDVVQAPVNPVNGLEGSGVTDWMINGEQPQQSGLVACTNNGNGGNGNGNGGPGNGNGNGSTSTTSCPSSGNGNGNGSGGPGNGNSDTSGQDGSGDGNPWYFNPFGN
jgi:membrane peptidoglycan carboxypeptidase